jgi:hypothetical protein
MKHLLLMGLLLTGLTGCHKSDPDPYPADPFQGHWQAETVELTISTPGRPTSTFTSSSNQSLDVTATTITYTYPPVVGGTTSPPVRFTYTRQGEDLAITSGVWIGIETHVRSLTATSFIYEEKVVDSAGSTNLTRIPYHR